MTTYSINALAKLAGVSTRTLRFYDKKGLLRARRDLDNNYRYYDETEVDRSITKNYVSKIIRFAVRPN